MIVHHNADRKTCANPNFTSTKHLHRLLLCPFSFLSRLISVSAVVPVVASLASSFQILIVTIRWVMVKMGTCQHHYRASNRMRTPMKGVASNTFNLEFALPFCAFKTDVVANLFPIRGVKCFIFSKYRH